ncbi:MAG TPA: response regulator [bacterium]|nr:response regulator [bacterium]
MGSSMDFREKILMIDDEPDKIFIFSTILQNKGFEVITSESGREGLEIMTRIRPDLILLDINMPDINGHTVREKLKERPSTRNVPIVMFSSSDQLPDKLASLRNGADDYITKDVDHQELTARLEALIRRYKESIGANPLTKLPGNYAIEDDINFRIAQNQKQKTPFAVCYADLDNFKAYNDKYGFKSGDEAIQGTARIILDVIGELGAKEDFVGHVGGDDFVFIVSRYDRVEAICKTIIERLDDFYPSLYDETDRKAGHIITKNRKDEIDQFPLMSISIAVVSNENRELSSMGQIAQIAAEVKKAVKKKDGSNYLIDKRS